MTSANNADLRSDSGQEEERAWPYSPIELYLAGLIPPEEVPDLWIAKDGEWLREDGEWIDDDSGNPVFIASDIEIWSIERLVQEHGVRVPDFRNSQKHFRAAAILLVDDQFPVTRERLQWLTTGVRNFSHAGSDGDASGFNFWEATGGRATLTMDGLDQYRKTVPTPTAGMLAGKSLQSAPLSGLKCAMHSLAQAGLRTYNRPHGSP